MVNHLVHNNILSKSVPTCMWAGGAKEIINARKLLY